MGLILEQHFQNMEEVQKGMTSQAFKLARANLVLEIEVSNFHRVYHEYMGI